MARPKKLSGNDKFMLGKLRGKGLYLKPEDSGIPITTHWYEWRGIILSGQYCNIDKKYRIPDKDKKPIDKKLGRRKTKGIRLCSLGFGNTPQETRRIIKKIIIMQVNLYYTQLFARDFWSTKKKVFYLK